MAHPIIFKTSEKVNFKNMFLVFWCFLKHVSFSSYVLKNVGDVIVKAYFFLWNVVYIICWQEKWLSKLEYKKEGAILVWPFQTPFSLGSCEWECGVRVQLRRGYTKSILINCICQGTFLTNKEWKRVPSFSN